MKFASSTLFVNTGRKPLPGMQKKKKGSNKNNIVLGVCIAIIAVLCIFVGLIVHVWVSYDEGTAGEAPAENLVEEVVPRDEKPVTTKPKTDSKAEKNDETEEEKPKKTQKTTSKSTTDYSTSGETTEAAEAVTKEFSSVSAEYSFGIMDLSGGTTYIMNTERVDNSAALAPFLAEYVSNAIYLGTFDYHHDVGGYQGSYLMDRAFIEGSVDAANLLIGHFGTDKLNAYFQSKGYVNTHFGGTVGSDGSYTTAEDLVKLMKKFHDNTGFFPYSDMYKKMLKNTRRDKIMKSLPDGAYGANISFTMEGETVDAAIIYTPSGNFIFAAMAEGDEQELSAADKAMANSAKKICASLE